MKKAENNLWAATAQNLPRTTDLQETADADVAIIGAGFTGLSAALHLAESGVKVVVLEAGDVGQGGSGRNVGLVNAGMWVRPDDLVATLGEAVGGRLLTDLGNGPDLVYNLVEKHGMECEAVHNGTLHLAVGADGKKEIALRAAQWKKRGAPVVELDAAEAARLTGAQGFTGALLDRRAGTIQPLAYAHGLANAAIRAGAQIYTHSRVTAAERDGKAWVLKTPKGKVRAIRVIMAGNAYATPIHGTNWHAHLSRLTILPYFQFATKPLPPEILKTILPEEHGAWDTGLVMTSMRRDKAGRLIFGSIGSLDAMAGGTHRDFAKRSVRALFPAITTVEFDYWWDGKIGMTTNNLPSFHHPDTNVWSITGYNGRGISPGTVFGRALAGVALGLADTMALPETVIAPDPLRTFKSLFYHLGSQVKHLIDRR